MGAKACFHYHQPFEMVRIFPSSFQLGKVHSRQGFVVSGGALKANRHNKIHFRIRIILSSHFDTLDFKELQSSLPSDISIYNMKFFYHLSTGLLAFPIIDCLPLAGTGVKPAREVDAPSVYEYGIYKKRDAEIDAPSVYEYGIYKKRDAEIDAPSVYEYGIYKKE
jgi:hypothetical protein